MAEPLLSADSEIDAYFRFRPQFLALLDQSLYPAEWFDAQIWTGNFRLFHTQDSAILVSIDRYPSGVLEAHGQAAVGKLAEITGSLIPYAEAWARSLGCKSAKIESREGWMREMRKDGYQVHQTTLRKAL